MPQSQPEAAALDARATTPHPTPSQQEARFTCLPFNSSFPAAAYSGPVAPPWPSGSGCSMKLPYMQASGWPVVGVPGALRRQGL